ncbi:MAG: class I SAM-dependent methyltransferase [Lysobacteraceae bacterium]
MTDANSALEFTGERFTPECVREIWYEHFHRYAFALSLVGGKTVLDAACGEGYGSSLLATAAGSVLGLDISPQAVTHATNRYAGQRANLAFRQADVAALEAMPSSTFDVICSFETLEHLHAQESMLAGFRRLLAPGGMLLVSTPDKYNYSDLPGFNNEHHVRELYRDEFETMLSREFRYVRLYAHKLVFQSMVWSLEGGPGHYIAQTVDGDAQVRQGLDYPPLYYIAVCSNEPLPDLPALSLFGDQAESVYAHYYHEIRKNMSAGARIQQLEAELDQALARLRELENLR